MRNVNSKRLRRLSYYDNATLTEALTAYLHKLDDTVSQFGSLLTDYDRDVILPSTCGLGIIKPAHFDIDEKGEFGVERSFLFPKDCIDAVRRSIVKSCPGDKEKIKLTLKRGTNLGWPTPKGGRSRDEGDILLALHAAIAIAFKSQGSKLRQVTEYLERIHGPCFAVAGERYQHTERVTPLFTSGDTLETSNVQPRVRGIYFSPKYMVAYNRTYVKQILKCLLNSPLHDQSRPGIQSKITSFLGSDSYIFSVDVSRFDQSFGGINGDQILHLMSDITQDLGAGDSSFIYDNLAAEFYTPCLVPTSRSLYLSKGGEILSSGLSSTSVIGTLTSHALAYFIISSLTGLPYTELDGANGRDWMALTWGDDIVLGVKKKFVPGLTDKEQVRDAVIKIGDKVQLKFDFEPTIKFLGQNYDMLGFKAPTGYPVGRFIQQQIFPERLKDFPFNVIGYIARLELLDNSISSEVHSSVLKFWPETFGERFKYQDRLTTLASLLPEIEKYSAKISQLDDVLGVFTHGLDSDDIALPEEFSSLIGMSSVDVSDPARFLSSANNVSRGILQGIEFIQNGRIEYYRSVIQQIAVMFGSKIPMGRDLYW